MAYRFVGRMNLGSFWAFLISGLSALWMNFQEIHHLIYSILFILAINLLLATIKSIKHCYIRRKRKRPFKILTCISEMGVSKILLEFALSGCLPYPEWILLCLWEGINPQSL